MSFTADKREERLTKFVETKGDQVGDRLTCSLGKNHLYKLKCISAWSGRTMTEVLRVAIDKLVVEVNAERGIVED